MPSRRVRAATLLDHVRADLRADRPATPFVLPRGDTSIQVHACHGTIRQLEVLRDALGHLFVGDPSLRPDDVVVICPDLARFEPFAAAVFGRGTLPVPVTVSDLSLGTENPVAGALATILHTVSGRCTSSDVLAIAGLDPVRRRLGHHGRRSRPLRHVDPAPRHDGGASTASIAARGSTPTSTSARGRRRCRSLLVGVAMPAPEPTGRPRRHRACSTTSAATTSPASGASPSWSLASSTYVGSAAGSPADRGVVRHPRRRRRSAVRRTVHRGMAVAPRCSKRSTTFGARRQPPE